MTDAEPQNNVEPEALINAFEIRVRPAAREAQRETETRTYLPFCIEAFYSTHK